MTDDIRQEITQIKYILAYIAIPSFPEMALEKARIHAEKMRPTPPTTPVPEPEPTPEPEATPEPSTPSRRGRKRFRNV